MAAPPVLSYCVVNTNGREHLLACLAAIQSTHPEGISHEVLVLDNASDDGSAEAVRTDFPTARLIESPRRDGKAANDSHLLRTSTGEFCLLLNEDSELQPGATGALLEALRGDPKAAAAGALLLDAEGNPYPCAWRLPGLGPALAGALHLHKLFVTQSGGERTREVGWVQSAAMLVRRQAAEEIGFFDEDYFVYSEETDFQKRLHDAGWKILHAPAARAIHHEQLANDPTPSARRRIVEFHRGRDRYMRKHHSAFAARTYGLLSAWFFGVRSLAALVLPGHDPRVFWLHARQSLHPSRGEGLREAADAHNRVLEAGPV